MLPIPGPVKLAWTLISCICNNVAKSIGIKKLMDREEILLHQYEVFANRKLHFGRLFWQIPAVFIAIGVLTVNFLDGMVGSTLGWFFIAIGILLMVIAYIAHRLRSMEDLYEKLMKEIEESIRETVGTSFKVAPAISAFWSENPFYDCLGCGRSGIGLHRLCNVVLNDRNRQSHFNYPRHEKIGH